MNVKSIELILSYVFGIFFLPMFSVLILGKGFKIQSEILIQLLANLISYVVLIRICLIHHWNPLKEDLHSLKTCSNLSGKFLNGFIWLELANIVGALSLAGLLGTMDIASENQTAATLIISEFPMGMAIITIFLAPLVEEVVFRLNIINLFSSRWVGIAVSSLSFGLIHVFLAGDFIKIVPYLTMGLALGCIYTKNENIWITILVHAAHNALAFVLVSI